MHLNAHVVDDALVDLLVGYRPGHRLAHVHIIERLHLGDEADILQRVLDRRADDAGRTRFLDFGSILERHVDREIGVARSISARRLPAAGTSRSTTRRILGNGPLFHSSKRRKEVSWPGIQRSSLKAPPPASLVFIHSTAQGSFSLAWLRASLELNTAGTTTARSGRVSLSLRRKSMRSA